MPHHELSERGVIALALCTVVGAYFAVPGLIIPGVVGCCVAFLFRKPFVLVVATGVLASGLGAHATAGLHVSPGPFHGSVEVLRVTTFKTGELHVEARTSTHHIDVVPAGSFRRVLARSEPGDRFELTGTLRPLDPGFQRARGSHIAASIRPTFVVKGAAPRWYWRASSVIRNAVRSLGRPLSPANQALFNGFVLGDASGQSAAQREDFRASGLTHLLVASGENVAFLLTLGGVVLTRVGLRLRLAMTALLLVSYALVTGLEPSVLRAVTMAGIASWATGIGRPIKTWRPLALAVSALVLIDPFLVFSLSFRLSVCACVGIVALAVPLRGLLGGPLALRMPLSVTMAAQVGVSPMLLGFPGGMPLATLPANLFAVVPAGLVMVLGLPCLVVAALPLPFTAVFVWVPRILLGWVNAVAQQGAQLDLGSLGAFNVVLIVCTMIVALAAKRANRRLVQRISGLLAITILVVPIFVGPASGKHASVSGLVVVRKGATTILVVTGSVLSDDALMTLSTERVREVSLLVLPQGSQADAQLVRLLSTRVHIEAILAPRVMHFRNIVGRSGERFRVGSATVTVVSTRPLLRVHVF